MAAKQAKPKDEIAVLEITKGRLEFFVVGSSPLIMNCVSAKVKQGLLLPSRKKNDAEKQSTLKHDPLAEYRASVYRARDPSSPTLLVHRSVAFKRALATAALDMPGANKAQVGRLTFVIGDEVPIWGVPQLWMTVTRSADIKRTPDIRTRAILAPWATRLTIEFVRPILREQPVANLLGAAGVIVGVGDYRPEKGAGQYGQFRIVHDDDAKLAEIVRTGGRAAQEAALEDPDCYDDESAELLSWYSAEVKRRGFKQVA
jgi:hypothetical protein